MAEEELLDAMVRRFEEIGRCENASNHADPADQLMICALQVRAMVQSDSVNTLGMLDAALTGIDERARLDEHTVKLCVDVAAIALHIASRVQR